MTQQRAKRQRMSGKALQKAIVDEAHRLNWKAVHFHTAQVKPGVYATPIGADGKGWPDLALVRERVVYVEVKGDGDRMKPEQEEWQNRLLLAGQEYHIFRPKDWRSGVVTGVLSARRINPDVDPDVETIDPWTYLGRQA